MNVGTIIMCSIIHAMKKATTVGLVNPYLIFRLCKKIGVTWELDEELLHLRSFMNINMYIRINMLDLKLDPLPHILAHGALS